MFQAFTDSIRAFGSKEMTCLLLVLALNTAHADQLPTEYFANLPDASKLKLSPDGTKILSLNRMSPKGDSNSKGTAVKVLDLEKSQSQTIFYADNKKYKIRWVRWASDDVILISANFPDSRKGVKTTERRLMKYNLNEPGLKDAWPNSFMKNLDYVPQTQSRVIDFLPNDPGHILVEMNGLYSDQFQRFVARVPLLGGRAKFIQPAETAIHTWITDQQHRVRVGTYLRDEETEYRIYEQSDSRGKLRELWRFEAFSKEVIKPVGFAKDPNILYVYAQHNGYDALHKVNLEDPKLQLELVFASNVNDVSGSLIYSKITGEVVGLRFIKDGGYVYWDKTYKGIQATLKKVLPKTTNRIFGISNDERRYLVYSSGDNEPGVYYLGDRDKKSITPVTYRYKNLFPEQLANKQQLSYKARDGLDITAFLTLPKDKDTLLPTIIFPHGGPISRTTSGFDYWTQFFANRGYAVLQMNFRGSSGYGHDFMKMGLKKWGQAMQDDVTDGTKWLVEQGISDPKKVCIVGASYGGYAALMGAVKEQSLYNCAISFAGVTDVEFLVKDHRKYTNYEIVKEQIGNDFDLLEKVSPLNHAKKINIPVLLIHGEKDRVVKVDHSEAMFNELKELDKDVKYVELEQGTHYLNNEDNRLRTFKEMEQFLASHLK